MINDKKDILVVSNLKKFFITSSGVIKAVNDISFTLKEGEILGLIGESGSGKTTVGRSLIRLYQDYSGIVSLDSKIISGKRISKQNRLFLRRNMQMIFQDPHTSLNGQQTVFSILKEPLIVNKILKQEYKNLFEDWKEIIEFFKYSFQEDLKKAEINNVSNILGEKKKIYDEWSVKFKNINFDDYISYDDAFNAYFQYFQSKQNSDNKIINIYYSNIEQLNALFKTHQKQYRENNLVEDEKELDVARKNLKRVEMLSKKTNDKFLAEKELKKLKNTLNHLNKSKNELNSRSKNIMKNFILEMKNEVKYYSINKSKSLDYEIYNYNAKNQYALKAIIKLLKEKKKTLGFLPLENLEEMMKKLDIYKLQILNQFSNLSNNNFHSKLIKKQVNKMFAFNLTKYQNINLTNLKKIDHKIQNVSNEAKALVDKISKMTGVSANENQVLVAKVKVENAQKEFDKETAIFLTEFNLKYNKLLEKDETLNKSKNLIDSYDKKLKDTLNNLHKKFSKYLQNNPLKIQNFNYKNYLSIANTKILNKYDTLDSFKIETQILNKNIENIKHLFGIKSLPYSKRLIKKVILREIIYDALQAVGLLRQFAYRYPHEFSGGQRQRIVVARALISKPKVIIADEPIASLDISIQAQVVNLLKDLCKKKKIGLIFIAHDLSMVEYIADKIHIMHLGKIVESGKTREIYKNPLHPYTINLFDSIPKLSNADVPFEASNFDFTYLVEQKFPKHPKMTFLNDSHNIFGTKEQITKWIGNAKKT